MVSCKIKYSGTCTIICMYIYNISSLKFRSPNSIFSVTQIFIALSFSSPASLPMRNEFIDKTCKVYDMKYQNSPLDVASDIPTSQVLEVVCIIEVRIMKRGNVRIA